MRNHWNVRNKLYWRLDVAMNEDDCRIRRGNVKSFFEIIKSGEYEIWGCEIMRWIRINILKCTLVFCLACGFSFAKTPCTNMSDKLSAAQRDSLQNNIKRQLKTERLNILEFFKEQNSSIVYIETYGADEAFIFYSGDEFKDDFITIWSGAAEISEEKNIEKWVKDHVPYIPDRLARCFAWYTIYRHD
ncbi:hypothetical protein AEX03_18825 [Salmonella enterica subsp. enterica serovar Albany]|nr:hypothetical protein AEU77_17600 [Salmonella enterica subsp. enterica serovar Albany]KNO30256.1 hypothetical protein AEV40_16100 [Salmonella enterica subsp. enterica serovar Albany]KNS11416.1 hypothetical protein AEW13_04505 [Salmonella enterica subsp. enterica serovar Albany]KNV59350.1 hypothetical protein AEX03_18825 [Salmonella enterica subsp. enterica serovar Albany]